MSTGGGPDSGMDSVDHGESRTGPRRWHQVPSRQ